MGNGTCTSVQVPGVWTFRQGFRSRRDEKDSSLTQVSKERRSALKGRQRGCYATRLPHFQGGFMDVIYPELNLVKPRTESFDHFVVRGRFAPEDLWRLKRATPSHLYLQLQ